MTEPESRKQLYVPWHPYGSLGAADRLRATVSCEWLDQRYLELGKLSGASNVDCSPRMVNDMAIGLLDGYECVAILYGVALIDLDRADDTIAVGFDLILHLHRLENHDLLALLDASTYTH